MQTYLVPTAAGARFAAASNAADPRRAVLRSLLRDTSGRPLPLDELVAIAKDDDRRAVVQMLFRLQRDGWLSSSDEPLANTTLSFDDALADFLGRLAGSGQALLARDNGMCVAYKGWSRDVAERLAALAAMLVQTRTPTWIDPGDDHDNTSCQLAGRWGTVEATFIPLVFGAFKFILATGTEPRMDSADLAMLIALLGRRYFGVPGE
jgi:hypothetical protein